MDALRYTLVTDGTSDRVLQPVIDWVLARAECVSFRGQWANPRIFSDPNTNLAVRLRQVAELYPCDLLFVHRDAEKAPRERRVKEIEAALRQVTASPPAICLVPVRMAEAWLLFSVDALRTAAGNPNGTVAISLPRLERLEGHHDPKALLFSLLLEASELTGRRRRRLQRDLTGLRLRLAELLSDYSPLRKLVAFAAFEADVVAVLQARGWARP